jgi:hypothetical protein
LRVIGKGRIPAGKNPGYKRLGGKKAVMTEASVAASLSGETLRHAAKERFNEEIEPRL